MEHPFRMRSHNLGLGVVSSYEQVHHGTKILYKFKPGHALLGRKRKRTYGFKEILRKKSTKWHIRMLYLNKTKMDIDKAKRKQNESKYGIIV